MTRTPESREGLSLVEVLVAVAILAVGIIALAQLQASSLQYTSRAEQLRTVTQIAEAELEWSRQVEIKVDRTDCESFEPPGYECSVEIIPLGSIGYGITVFVSSRQADIELSAFTTGQRYVSGKMPDVPYDPVNGDNGNGNGDDGNGGDDETPPPSDDDDDDDDVAPCVNPKGKSGLCH